MPHCILHRDQVFPVIQQRGGKCSPQIMRGTLAQAGLALAHLQDMVHPQLQLQPLPGPGGNVRQTFLVSLFQDFQGAVTSQEIRVTQCYGFRAA